MESLGRSQNLHYAVVPMHVHSTSGIKTDGFEKILPSGYSKLFQGCTVLASHFAPFLLRSRSGFPLYRSSDITYMYSSTAWKYQGKIWQHWLTEVQNVFISNLHEKTSFGYICSDLMRRKLCPQFPFFPPSFFPHSCSAPYLSCSTFLLFPTFPVMLLWFLSK